MRTSVLLLVFLAALARPLLSQQLSTPRTGPLIREFGPVFATDPVDLATPTDHVYRVVFDVSQAPEDAGTLNARIESLARFLNMHAAAGVPAENLQLALVLHGGAAKAVLDNATYKARFGADNADLPLLQALHAHGVRVLVCGQTAANRGLAKKDFAPGMELALSAMTALVLLQEDGYQLISF
ncbi:MAG: DsrE family protein [Gemmatimonadota bacterium]